MKTLDFDYRLDPSCIAHSPASPRESAKLFHFDRETNNINHKLVSDIPDILHPGDVIVFNNSKVIPARLIGKKKTGGKVEIFLLKNISKEENIWQCMCKGKMELGMEIYLGHGVIAKINTIDEDGTHSISFDISLVDFMKYIDKYGEIPLPPYIESTDNERTKRINYQTSFASVDGSVAAPTASLHFTDALIEQIKAKGIQIEFVTLHVGIGTFKTISSKDIYNHKMHAEIYSIDDDTAARINQAKKEKRRIIAVGSTSIRVLETVSSETGVLSASTGETDIFISPGYRFKIVDVIITNFHLPKSTLIVLISAFSNMGKIMELYEIAKNEKYRFFSFGDAMMIE